MATDDERAVHFEEFRKQYFRGERRTSFSGKSENLRFRQKIF